MFSTGYLSFGQYCGLACRVEQVTAQGPGKVAGSNGRCGWKGVRMRQCISKRRSTGQCSRPHPSLQCVARRTRNHATSARESSRNKPTAGRAYWSHTDKQGRSWLTAAQVVLQASSAFAFGHSTSPSGGHSNDCNARQTNRSGLVLTSSHCSDYAWPTGVPPILFGTSHTVVRARTH